MKYYTKTVYEVLKEFDVSEAGLSRIEAKERLERFGPNTIRVRGEPLWRKLVEPFANVFMGVLFLAAIISLFHHAVIDAVIIFAIMGASASIYYVQRFTTERILRALQRHVPHNVEVLREHKTIIIDASQIVPGDIIVLNEGEKIPADARLIVANSLRVDEAQLTGESLPIGKDIEPLAGEKEIYEQKNMVFQGSFVVGGEGKALVVATGNNTEFGMLAALSSEVSSVSPVQAKIDRLISKIIAFVAGLAVVAFSLAIWRGMELSESIRFVLALSVSAVPESLPVAISVILALGMRRMAAKKALVRTMSAIETVGTLTTIATDKTGTLTKNKLTVREVWSPDDNADHINTAMLRAVNHSVKKVHDPLDAAMHEYVLSVGKKLEAAENIGVLPFDQSYAMSGNLWKSEAGLLLAIKGAPEHVLARCHLPKAAHTAAESALHSATGRGLRVIALAHVQIDKPVNSFAELSKKASFVFDGFFAVADILRPEAKRAIATAISAGVTVRMITGDHFETAFHIGRELGMVESRNQVFDSRKLHDMSDEDLGRVIAEIRVFSRVIPEHKHRILSILKQKNITAMTGDGVNDVPALTNAHVGVAMGSGASIAKDAGDIILLDDNFKGIVDAIHEGRTIYANIKRMLVYLLSTNLGEVLVSVGALVMGMPIPLLPVQILWVNLVTDTSLVIPLGLEPGERRNMLRGPQAPNAPLLSKFMISRIALVSSTMAAITLWQYVQYSDLYGTEYGRTIAFCSLVVMQWATALTMRSDYEPLFTRIRRLSKPFIVGMTVAVGLQLLALMGPLGEFLHITEVASADLWRAGSVAFVIPIILIESHKIIGRRFFKKGSHPLA